MAFQAYSDSLPDTHTIPTTGGSSGFQPYNASMPDTPAPAPTPETPTVQNTIIKPVVKQLNGVGDEMSTEMQNTGADVTANAKRALGSGPADTNDEGSFGKNFLGDLSARLASLGHIGGDIAGQAFAPLLVTAKALIPPDIKANYNASVNWLVDKITSNPTALRLLQTANDIGDTNPDLAHSIVDSINTLGLLGGDKTSNGNPDVSMAGAKESLKTVGEDIKTGASKLPQSPGEISDIVNKPIDAVKQAVKNKVFGLPEEQIKNTTTDWQKPAETPKASYKGVVKILQKNPEIPTFLAEQGLDPHSHIENGMYTTKETAQSLRDTANTMSNETLRPSLKIADYSTPRTDVSTIESRAISQAKQTKGITASNMDSIIQGIHDEAISLKEKYPNGVSLEDMHDNKIDYANPKNSGYSPVNDPKVNNSAVTNRSMASAFQKVLEEKAPPEIPVHDTNAYFQQYHQAADYLDALNGKKAPVSLGQKIARGTAKGIGAIVGSHLGGLPTEFAGYSIGGALEHAVENMPNPVRTQFLANLEKTNPEAFQKVSNYLGESKLQQLTQLKLPEASPLGSGKNPIITPAPTTFEKGSLRSFNQNRLQSPKEKLLPERASPIITPPPKK